VRAQAKLLEHNVRFGDPECQGLMMRLDSDLLEALLMACDGKLGQASRPPARRMDACWLWGRSRAAQWGAPAAAQLHAGRAGHGRFVLCVGGADAARR
jgi:hypothetical protein